MLTREYSGLIVSRKHGESFIQNLSRFTEAWRHREFSTCVLQITFCLKNHIRIPNWQVWKRRVLAKKTGCPEKPLKSCQFENLTGELVYMNQCYSFCIKNGYFCNG